MKVLHITNWYPNKDEPYEALFIREHFDALSFYVEQKLLHVEIRDVGKMIPQFDIKKLNDCEFRYQVKVKIRYWTLKELLHFFLLVFVLIRHSFWKYSIINFHIAYPALRFTRFWKFVLKNRIVITEHWTAYHFNFNLPDGSNSLQPIKNIFKHKIPLLTVSNALANDIRQFSGSVFPSFVVPNVVDKGIFFPATDTPKGKMRLFMCNYWRRIKSPDVLLRAVHEFLKNRVDLELYIGGYGPMWAEMEVYVKDNQLEKNFILLGKLSKAEVGEQMRLADAFIHAATYETFSVVCAEAISCGTPVIVTRIPAVTEFINEANGILVDKNTVEDWVNAFEVFLKVRHNFNKDTIVNTAQFTSKENVGKAYYKALSMAYVQH